MSRRRQRPWRLLAVLALTALTRAWPDGSKDFELPGIRSAVKVPSLSSDHCPIANLPIFEGSEPAFRFPAISYYHRIYYKCKTGFKPISGNRSVMVCHRGSWKPRKDFCRRIYCKQPPGITDGFHNGNASTYPYGTIINYSCNKNFFLIGASSISCSTHGSLKEQWIGKPPTCEVSPGICGAPLMINGNIQPLLPHYESGKRVTISCNLNYTFLDDSSVMNIQCQGYNVWSPPAQLCFFRTSPDISHLFISNGKIVHGKKKTYKPGDEVVIQCHGGYILIGSSKIKYIGGERWFPRVPNCHLSPFLKLLILGCLLPALILAVKMVYQKYLQQR